MGSDPVTFRLAIVFTRYMMLSVAQRRNEDDKTICELFFCLMDELDDITFDQSMRIIIDALMDTVMEYFHITEQQLEEFTATLFSDFQNAYKMPCHTENMRRNCYFVS